ncbi:MAG TPA: glycosyltransferase [Candidatus Angelobacter sp.]|nr:glycosyltransferase [Candidatus Angelobacter sp.]
MSEESILSDDLLRQLISVGEVDILVGLPTQNNAKTIGETAQIIRSGLLKYFPRARTAILDADAGSRDGTPGLVTAAAISDTGESEMPQSLRTMHCITTTLAGTEKKGTALQTMVAAADLLRARVCAVISPETTRITPEWIDRLVRPIYQDDFDLVTPTYRRHAYDGILITNLLYPVTRALFGRRVREPNPADFAFSGKFGAYLMDRESWWQELGESGAEFCFTAAAIAGDYRLQQSFLGTKDRAENRSADLVLAMRRTLSALFWSLDEYYDAWSNHNSESQPVPTEGAEYETTLEPVRVNRKRFYEMFRSGVADLEPVLATILTTPTLEELKRCINTAEASVPFSDELWARTIYEFAGSYHHAVISRDHIIQALVPLYRGRVYTYLEQINVASPQKVEQDIEAVCRTFERCKPTLAAMWARRQGGS